MDESPAPESTELDAETETVKQKPNRRIGLIIFVAVVVILTLANYEIKLPYYVIAPGDALAVKKYVQLPADKSNGQTGKLLLATVTIAQASPVDWALAHVLPGQELESKESLLGPKTTQSQYVQENEELMDQSQLTAITIAMQRAGYQVTQLGDGAQVAAVGQNAPAVGKLNVNDVITAVNGQVVGTATEAVTAVQKQKVGDVVHLDLRNAKKETRSVDVTLGARPDNGGPYIGVALETANPHLDTPFPVSFKETDIGGPSAGLAFTLTLLDELTPGELTGGQTIATTGTIEPDGSVGEVGGVKQKTRAVESAGAKIFLVPTGEYEDAKKEAGSGLTVIPVNTVDEAISALATHGGDVSGVPAAAK